MRMTIPGVKPPKEGLVGEEKVVKFLTAKEILEVNDLQVTVVDVPEWGGSVRLRPMTAEEAIEYNETGDPSSKKHAAVRLAALCIVDEDGDPMFTPDQVAVLSKKSLAAFMRVQRVAMEINGLNTKGAAEAKNV
jgi:hypothetical protein